MSAVIMAMYFVTVFWRVIWYENAGWSFWIAGGDMFVSRTLIGARGWHSFPNPDKPARVGKSFGLPRTHGKGLPIIPLWTPFLACLVPSLIGWFRNRKPPPGHCQDCSYDLTGNVSGVCPECGAKIP